MIDLTILLTIVVALAIYGVLNTLSQYLSIKWLSYTTKKKLDQEYALLIEKWDADCDDNCELCDEYDVIQKPVKKPVKKTAAKKKTAKRK